MQSHCYRITSINCFRPLRFRWALLVLLLVSFSPRAVLAEDASTYQNKELHYSLRVPFGWTAIPKIAIEQTQNEISRRTGAPVQIYVAAFQKQADRYFKYPYMMIQHRLVEGVTLEQLGQSAQHADLKSASQSFKNAGLVDGMSMGETVIDDDHQALITKIQMDTPGSGPINGVIALFPGKTGVVQLNYYNLASAPPDKTFDEILDSFKFEPQFGYNPAVTASPAYEAGQGLGKVIGFIAGFAVVLLFSRLFWKKRDDDDNTPAPLPT